MSSAPDALNVQLSPDVAALISTVVEAVAVQFADVVAKALADVVQPAANELPPELRVYTAEQLAKAYEMKPSWFEQRAYARTMPATKVGHYMRWTHADVVEMLRAGQIGPRGKDLPRAA